MKDAFGGAFSIKLMLIFLILYISFICVALNYAKAFRVKNRIINIIEQQEGYNATAAGDISTYLANAGYYIKETDVSTRICKEYSGNSDCEFYEPGYAIGEIKTTNKQKYYYIETYLVFTLPIVNVHFPIAVRGETRVIELP